MNTQKIGFIGGGNMASSLLNGLITSGHPPKQIWVSDTNPDTLAYLSQQFGVNTSSDNNEIARLVDVGR